MLSDCALSSANALSVTIAAAGYVSISLYCHQLMLTADIIRARKLLGFRKLLPKCCGTNLALDRSNALVHRLQRQTPC